MSAKIKLNAASGGGSVSLEAPTSTTGNANIELKLPVADGSGFLKSDGSGNLSNSLTTSGTDNFTIADGNLVIGTAGHGIDFSATSGTGTSELLADYEEGNFTVTVSGGGTVSSFAHNKCSYTKIGRFVYFQLYLQITGSGNGNSFTLSNFPFTSATYTNNAYGAAYIGYQNNVFQNSGDVSAYFVQDSTRLDFYQSNGQPIAGNSGNIFGNKDFIIVGSYVTA